MIRASGRKDAGHSRAPAHGGAIEAAKGGFYHSDVVPGERLARYVAGSGDEGMGQPLGREVGSMGERVPPLLAPPSESLEPADGDPAVPLVRRERTGEVVVGDEGLHQPDG